MLAQLGLKRFNFVPINHDPICHWNYRVLCYHVYSGIIIITVFIFIKHILHSSCQLTCDRGWRDLLRCDVTVVTQWAGKCRNWWIGLTNVSFWVDALDEHAICDVLWLLRAFVTPWRWSMADHHMWRHCDQCARAFNDLRKWPAQWQQINWKYKSLLCCSHGAAVYAFLKNICAFKSFYCVEYCMP